LSPNFAVSITEAFKLAETDDLRINLLGMIHKIPTNESRFLVLGLTLQCSSDRIFLDELLNEGIATGIKTCLLSNNENIQLLSLEVAYNIAIVGKLQAIQAMIEEYYAGSMNNEH
jgi:hypothetical protein